MRGGGRGGLYMYILMVCNSIIEFFNGWFSLLVLVVLVMRRDYVELFVLSLKVSLL